MARGINKVILIGNLGQDPELRYTGSGTPVCNLRLATTDVYKDREGQLVEKTEWHSIVFWSRLAEICGQYLRKGSKIYVEGSLQTRSWEDRDGNTRYKTEVRGASMLMLDSQGDSAQRRSPRQYATAQPRQNAPNPSRPAGSGRDAAQAYGPQGSSSFGSEEKNPTGGQPSSFGNAGDASGDPLDDLPF